MIRRLLVANRGEIARRVIATCRAMGIETVAVFSDVDAAAAHVAEADRAVRLPGHAPAQTYLHGPGLIDAARRSGADAVHPGYGFLSEQAEFAAAVVDAGLTWIGPPAKAIAAMGSKLEAKALLAHAGVPMLESWTEPEQVDEFPVLVKAAAGGGGRGMRVVRDGAALGAALAAARREAAAAFGDGTVFCERYLPAGRHVEVQVIADAHGCVLALGERDCSIQRRHQKIVEEAPAPALTDPVRGRLRSAAVAAARAVGYVGAGTVEFLLAPHGRFYFLEMNTRLQVEHPVTECVTGLDLVRLQLTIADGEPLPMRRSPPVRGHAIEARLYAEDPAHDWRPGAGTLHRFAVGGHPATAFEPLAAPGIRVDSGVTDGAVVSVHYDPLLAKVIAWAPSRAEAARLLADALARAEIHGLVTNRDLLVRLLRDAEFLDARIDTTFLDRRGDLVRPAAPAERHLAGLAATLAAVARRRSHAPWAGLPSGWRSVASAPASTRWLVAGEPIEVGYAFDRTGALAGWSVDGQPQPATALVEAAPDRVVLECDGVRYPVRVHAVAETSYVDWPGGSLALVEVARFAPPSQQHATGSLLAPMPAAVGRVAVSVGDRVARGDPLFTLEAMKLEHAVLAPEPGTVVELRVGVGDQVEVGDVLAVIAPIDVPLDEVPTDEVPADEVPFDDAEHPARTTRADPH